MRKHICLITVLLLSFSLFAAEPVTMYVASQKGLLKARATTNSKTITTLSYGDVVTIISTKGKWSEVAVKSNSTANTQGWVLSASLTKKKIVANTNKVSANAKELALAGKGFSSEIENEYKKSGNADYDAVDTVEQASVSDDEESAFIEDGNLRGGEE